MFKVSRIRNDEALKRMEVGKKLEYKEQIIEDAGCKSYTKIKKLTQIRKK